MANQRSTGNEEAQSNNDASKVGGAKITGATPNDGSVTLYQGQKIALSVQTQGLKTGNYTTATFELFQNSDFTDLDATEFGFVVHPDSQSKITQTVATDADTYKLNAVVLGTPSQTSYDYTQWNVSITGAGSLTPITLSGAHHKDGSFSYFSSSVSTDSLYGVVLISGGTQAFTGDITKAILVSGYQVHDTAGNALPNQFSGFVTAMQADLTNFDFWDYTTHQKLNKVQVKNVDTYVWIDSDANGKFAFYVTSNLSVSADVYSDTLNLTIGDQSVQIAQVIVGQDINLNGSSLVPAPYATYETGTTLTLSPTQTEVSVSIKKPITRDALQVGDVLLMYVNDSLMSDIVYTIPAGYSDGGIKDCFEVPVSAFKVSETGAVNSLQYVVLRDITVQASSKGSVTVIGASSNGNLPQPSGRIYAPPIIVEDPSYLDLNYPMVREGLTVKVSWAGTGWVPKQGDKLALYIHTSGWNSVSGDGNNVVTKFEFPPVGPTDLTAGFVSKLIGYKTFAGFHNSTTTGQSSTILMQYQMPNGDYSLPTPNMKINTVPPGGNW